MHADLREAIIASVRRRFEQGDCPTEPAHTVETLEHVILDLAPKPPAGGDTGAVERYRQALEDVCDPLGYLQRLAEAEGAKLGGMAYSIANDIATVQRIARDALALPAPVVEGDVTDRDREIGLAVFRDYLNHDLDDAGGNYEGEECAIHAAARGRIAALSEGRSHG